MRKTPGGRHVLPKNSVSLLGSLENVDRWIMANSILRNSGEMRGMGEIGGMRGIGGMGEIEGIGGMSGVKGMGGTKVNFL